MTGQRQRCDSVLKRLLGWELAGQYLGPIRTAGFLQGHKPWTVSKNSSNPRSISGTRSRARSKGCVTQYDVAFDQDRLIR